MAKPLFISPSFKCDQGTITALVERETIVEPKMMMCGFSYYHHYHELIVVAVVGDSGKEQR